MTTKQLRRFRIRAHSATYRNRLTGRHRENQIVIIPDATHGTAEGHPYNAQLVSEMSWWVKALFIWEGRDAYAPGALEQISAWILAR